MSNRRWSTPRGYVLAGAGVAALSMLWYLAYLAVGGPSVLAYLGGPIASGVGAVAVVALLRAVPMPRAARRFWLLIFVLEAAVAVARAVQAGYAFADYPEPPRSPA